MYIKIYHLETRIAENMLQCHWEEFLKKYCYPTLSLSLYVSPKFSFLSINLSFPTFPTLKSNSSNKAAKNWFFPTSEDPSLIMLKNAVISHLQIYDRAAMRLSLPSLCELFGVLKKM